MGAEGRESDGKFTDGNQSGFSAHPENINRAGPKGTPSLTSALIRRIQDEGGDGRDIADELIESAIHFARKGSFSHLKELWDRLDGRELRIAGHDGGPLFDEAAMKRIDDMVEAIGDKPANP